MSKYTGYIVIAAFLLSILVGVFSGMRSHRWTPLPSVQASFFACSGCPSFSTQLVEYCFTAITLTGISRTF